MSEQRRNEEEILQWVYKRGGRLRVRAMAARAASMSLVVAMLGGGMVYALNGPPGDVGPSHDSTVVMSDETPKPAPQKSSEKPKPSPTKEPSVKPAASAEPKPAPDPAPTKEPVTEPKPGCLDSFDPACGEFYWKTAPSKNQALALTATYTGGIAGADTAFSVHVADADARIWRDVYKVDFGDGTPRVYGPGDKSCKKAYGPWTLPTRAGDAHDAVFHHTYASPGTYTVMLRFFSTDRRDGPRTCQQAYGSEKTIYLTVVVSSPEPSPSSSPSPSPSPSI